MASSGMISPCVIKLWFGCTYSERSHSVFCVLSVNGICVAIVLLVTAEGQ